MIQSIINSISLQLQSDLPFATVNKTLILVKRGDKYIPITCNETPSICNTDSVNITQPKESDVLFIWFGQNNDRYLSKSRNDIEFESNISIYVWYNSKRISGSYCEIENCVLENVLKSITNAVEVNDINIDYSVSALRSFDMFEPLSYFPYGFFTIEISVKSNFNKNCEPCIIIENASNC